MRTKFRFGVLFVFLLLSSCSLSEDFKSFSVAPERLFSESSNVFVFDYSNSELMKDYNFLFDRYKKLEVWKEYDLDLKYAGFIDNINKIMGENSYENFFLPIVKSGFVLAINKERLSLDFENMSVSLNVNDKDSFYNFVNLYFKNAFGDDFSFMSVSGIDVWIEEENGFFVANKGYNFVFSNNFDSFQEILENLKKEKLSVFSNNLSKEITKYPFFRAYLNAKVSGMFFLEDKGVRVVGFQNDNYLNSKSLMSNFSNNSVFFYLEDSSLKKILHFFPKIDSKKYFNLKEDDFSRMIDSPFALSIGSNDSFPSIEFVLKVDEKEFLTLSKFIQSLDKFFKDFGEILDSQLIDSGVISEQGLVSINLSEDNLRKVFFDLSLLSDEKISEISQVFPSFSKNSSLNISYGLLEENLFKISIFSDFIPQNSNQNFSNSIDFLKANESVSLPSFSKVVYFNFLNFWTFYEEFSRVLFSWAYVDEATLIKMQSFSSVFIDEFSSFILLGEKSKDGVDLEGFLSTWK